MSRSSPLAWCLSLVLVAAGCGDEEADAPASAPSEETEGAEALRGDELAVRLGPHTLAPDSTELRELRQGAQGANVLLLTLDTLRADRVGSYVTTGRASNTPRLDRIAAEGIRVERAMATAPVTLPSHTSMLTGLVPAEHGTLENGAFIAHPDLDTLPERLAEQGYATAAFVSTHVLSRRYGLDQGFATYDDRSISAGGGLAVERRADVTVDAVLSWLAAAPPEPWFLWVHFYDPHFPYDPPPEFLQGRLPYEGEVGFLDDQIGRLLDAYDQDGRLDRTLLIATSDHGEGLGEHAEDTHGMFLYDSVMWVPLLFRYPPLGRGKTMVGQASLTDLFPTVLDLLSLPFDDSAASLSLLPVLASEQPELWQDAYMETSLPQFTYGAASTDALSTEQFKYIRSPRAELYDYRSDPGEERSLLATRGALGDKLHRRVDRLRTNLSARAPNAGREMSEEERRRLELLGYIQPEGMAASFHGMDPKDVMPLVLKQARATAFLDTSQPAAAAQIFRQILAKNPKDPSALGGLGLAYRAMNKPAEAERCLVECLELRPDFFLAALNLAQICSQQQRLEEAVSHCEQVIQHNTAVLDAYLLASTCCYRQQKLDAARSWLERAQLHTDPTPAQQRTIESRLKSLTNRDGG